MNELIEAWETGAKVVDFIILTAHSSESHGEALSTIRSEHTVRLIDVFGLEFSDLLTEPKSRHGGELDTSLLLAIAPSVVRLDRLPAGIVASVAKGERLYERMLDRLVSLVAPPNGSGPA